MRDRGWVCADEECSETPMDRADKRRAPRITCSVGLHLQGEWTMVRARVEDVCRDGARLRVPLVELGLQPDVGMTAIAAHIQQLLTKDVVAMLRPELLGSLVQRHVEAVRIAPTELGEHFIDVGLEFDEPLTRLDAVTLGLPIPMEGEDEQVAQAEIAHKQPQTRELTHSGSEATNGSSFADLRFSLLVKKAELGQDPEGTP